ncbi:MAG: hypothetical protein H0V95_03745 [Actinobacteria bacterium]|nr:hypothetical protein [Actinomycetota bacterium]
MANLRDRARRVARGPATPFLRFFNRRFTDVHGHLDNQTESLTTAAQVLQDRVATDVEVVSELALTLERFADRFGHRMDEVLVELRRLMATAADSSATRRATLTFSAADALADQTSLLDRLHEWLAPDGELALTLPAAVADAAGPSLARWEVVERRAVARPESGAGGVALLRLTPRG